jgi:beta-galactosidase
VHIENRYHSLDTSHLTFSWVLERNGVAIDGDGVDMPVVPPGGTVEATLAEALEQIAPPLPEDSPLTDGQPGELWITVQAALGEDTPWAPAGHVVAFAQYDVTPQAQLPITAEADAVALSTSDFLRTNAVPETEEAAGATGTVTLGPAEFDAITGNLVRLGGVRMDGPRLELWRAPTDNDRGASGGSYELADPELTFGRGEPGPSSAERWRRAGLDRLVHRVDGVVVTDSGVTATVFTSAANSASAIEVVYRWTLTGGDLRLQVNLVPTPDWSVTWPRTGVRFALPAELTHAGWFGTGPLESYPDSMRAARVGRFAAAIDDLGVTYSMPQENGHRSELRELVLEDRHGPRLCVRTEADAHGHRPGFTVSRHTAEELDAAQHPHELPPSEHVYLYLDERQHGLGSRACGLDVLPKHANWPSARSFALTLTALGDQS